MLPLSRLCVVLLHDILLSVVLLNTFLRRAILLSFVVLDVILQRDILGPVLSNFLLP
jgi:hypothetical protein